MGGVYEKSCKFFKGVGHLLSVIDTYCLYCGCGVKQAILVMSWSWSLWFRAITVGIRAKGIGLTWDEPVRLMMSWMLSFIIHV